MQQSWLRLDVAELGCALGDNVQLHPGTFAHTLNATLLPTTRPLSAGLARSPSAYSAPGHLVFDDEAEDLGKVIPIWQPFDQALSSSPAHGKLLAMLAAHVKDKAPLDPALSFLSNSNSRTILVIGDSNDRHLADDLCSHLGLWAPVRKMASPKEGSNRWHSDPHICEVSTGKEGVHLTLVFQMSTGVLVPDDRLYRKKAELDGPFDVAARIRLAAELLDKLELPRPDLIVFASNLWDLMYLRDSTLANPKRLPLSWRLSAVQLATWQSQFCQALKSIRTTFPNVVTATRTLHDLAKKGGNERDFWNAARVAQLNEAL